ncbi:MAG: pyruvate dehydrogenase complex dihydrolipoamide acetyltransferase [Blastochloris viridis]|uniref:Acetyltransferase component of pyruvate dehydrogenase complex n=1 Tax=Blastochloris viridis TaxID=1079 RepID=A0A6N4R4W0_BLAVI|nr:MAG: pyruvate dehydrogenase complex dihydrolipoamide acetyltransferase [Blastochloris viridis]
MPIDILMPQLSPTMTEGRLARWTKAEGDKISAGDVIAEVETDKATMEVEASDDGILHKIIGEIGADLLVGSPIAVLRGKDESVAADYTPTSKAKKAEAAPAPAASGATQVVEPASTNVQETVQHVAVVSTGILPKINTTGATAAPAAASHSAGGRTKASPLARRLASQQNVDIATVIGTGPNGRVVAQDVLTGGRTAGAGRPITRMADTVQKLTPMRKAIASRLTASKQTVPHFYLSAEVNMNALMSVRTQLNAHLESQKIKVSVNDFILKASALALKDFPAANSAWNADSVVQFGNVDISVAVSIDGGLITPVVANADQKSLVSISAEVKQLASDARAGKLKPEQYEGGSFSLSNLGMYGVDDFSAIINPPQAAILACGAATERAVVTEGGIDVASVMKMTLSVDHRVIDGALGAELLGRIKHYLETPVVLVM